MTNTPQETACPFCTPANHQVVALHGTVYAIADANPVCDHHSLIIPLRHCRDYFEMTPDEHKDARELIQRLSQEIREKDPSVTGFNIGANCGESAGQTVFHTHIHLIPRRNNDTPCPRGGVRGVIPDKMNYPTTN